MSLAKSPEWERLRAQLLHRELLAIETAVAAGAKLGDEIDAVAERLADHVIEWTVDGKTKSKPLRASKATLYRSLKSWREGGRTYAALLHRYHSAGAHRTVPPELEHEIRRLSSLATGGRNKDQISVGTFAARDLKRRWQAGDSIPGLGTWQEWWHAQPELAHHPLPDAAPDFPFCDRTIARKVGHIAVRKLGNVGLAAAKKHLPTIDRDYSQLRKAELFTLDDVRLDLIALDEFTSQVVNVEAYIMMEVGSRFIPSFVLRSGGKIQARDVKALIAAGLAKTGLPVGYTCHILFERGTLACSDELQQFLEGVSGGRIKVRRTGMIDNVRWIGAAADKARGNSAGKAVIESFNRSLHYRLLHLPGQRGNTRENQPHNLGVEDRDRLQGSGDKAGRIDRERRVSTKDAAKDTLVAYVERLARFKRVATVHGFDCDIQFPLLTVSQLEAEVAAAIDAHNNAPGANYQGHHRRAMVRGPGGTWAPLNDVAL